MSMVMVSMCRRVVKREEEGKSGSGGGGSGSYEADESRRLRIVWAVHQADFWWA